MNSFRCTWLSLGSFGLCLVSALGCGGGGDLLPVTGKVKYADGPLPQGEISVITFTPDKLGAGVKAKGASGNIGADGTFRLSSGRDMEGVYAGTYKVTLTVLKKYPGKDSLVAKKYDTVETTPLTAEVKPGQQHFEWTLDKP